MPTILIDALLSQHLRGGALTLAIDTVAQPEYQYVATYLLLLATLRLTCKMTLLVATCLLTKAQTYRVTKVRLTKPRLKYSKRKRTCKFIGRMRGGAHELVVPRCETAEIVQHEGKSMTIFTKLPFAPVTKCDRCDRYKAITDEKFGNNLAKHLEGDHGVKCPIKRQFKCRFCDFTYVSDLPSSQPLKHVKSHVTKKHPKYVQEDLGNLVEDEGMKYCPIAGCGKFHMNSRSMQSHLGMHAKEGDLEKHFEPNKSGYKCLKCQKEFKAARSAAMHLVEHVFTENERKMKKAPSKKTVKPTIGQKRPADDEPADTEVAQLAVTGNPPLGNELWEKSGLKAWLFDETIWAVCLPFIENLPKTIIVCPTFWNPTYLRENKPPMFHPADMEDWTSALVPVFGNSGQHWSLSIIDRRAKTSTFFDSFHNEPTKETKKGLTRLFQSLTSTLDSPRFATGDHSRIERQTDSYNCGIYVCRLIELFAQSEPLAITVAELARHRDRYARRVCPMPSDQPTAPAATELATPAKKRRIRIVEDSPEPAIDPQAANGSIQIQPDAMPDDQADITDHAANQRRPRHNEDENERPAKKRRTVQDAPERQVQMPDGPLHPVVRQITEWAESDRGWHEFELICDNFTRPKPGKNAAAVNPNEKATQTLIPRKPKSGTREKCDKFDREEASKIQKLYYKAKRKAMKLILSDKNSDCPIALDKIADAFRADLSKKEIDLTALQRNAPETQAIDPDSQKQVVAPITAAEVLRALSRARNTAPGDDKLQYTDLKRLDPTGAVLATMYNVCLDRERVPQAWKESTTILLYKKGCHDDISNWRPISIMLTVYKLFTSVLSHRLTRIITAKKLLDDGDLLTSHEQVGFEQTEGCAEHVLELESAVHHARHRSKDLVVCFLDLTNAFGSVPHALMHEMLGRLGLGGKFGRLVDDLYTGATMAIKTQLGVTDAIAIDAGVKQGDPISPTLFCLAIEYLIRNLKMRHPTAGYSWFDGHTSFVLAYADDLAIVCKSQAEMRTVLDDLSRLANLCGLRFKPAKCASLCLNKGKVADARFDIQSQTMPAMQHAQYYTYLGVPIGVGLRHAEIDAQLIAQANSDVLAIGASALAPWQKLDAIKSFITPRLFHRFSMTDVNHSDFKGLSDTIKATVKQALNLPELGGDVDYLAVPVSLGGAGMLPLNELADILSLTHAFRLLTSRRRITRAIAWAGLRQVVKGVLKREPSDADLEDYLNGCHTGDWHPDVAKYSQGSSVYSRMRKAAMRLRDVKVKADKQYHNRTRMPLAFTVADEQLTLTIRHSAKVSASSRGKLNRALVRALGIDYVNRMREKKSHGKLFHQVHRHRANFQFIADGKYLSYGAFKFVHRARTDSMALNGAAWRRGQFDQRCRRCGYQQETLAHVLNHCGAHLSKRITTRHNRIQERLVDAIRKNSHVQVQVNRVCSVAGRQVRPDILVRDEANKRIFIIDVTCPHEALTTGADGQLVDPFVVARNEKIDKYSLEAEFYRNQAYSVTLDAFVVGSLGLYDPFNDDLLRQLGIPRRQAHTLARRVVGDAIEESKNIYWSHILGKSFYLDQAQPLAGGSIDNPNEICMFAFHAALERRTTSTAFVLTTDSSLFFSLLHKQDTRLCLHTSLNLSHGAPRVRLKVRFDPIDRSAT